MKPDFALRAYLLGCSSLLAASVLHAAPVTWDITPGNVGAGDSVVTGGAGTWDTTNGNWTADGGVNNIAWVNANNDTAILGDAAGIVTIDAGGVTVGGLQFDTAGYTLSGGVLTFGAAGSITANADATITSALAGSAALAKNGSAILTLSGASTSYTGALTLSAGTLSANTSVDALGGGAATLALNGGSLVLNHSAGLAFNRNTTVVVDSNIQSSRDAAGAGVSYTLGTLGIGTNRLTVGAGVTTSGTAALGFGATTLGGTAIFEVINGAGSTGQVTLGPVGESGGARSLTKEGGGILILSDAGAYSGTTTLTAGTLRGTVTSVSLTPGSAFGTSGLSLNGGTLQLRASGALSTTAETVTIGNATTIGGTTTIDVARPGATSTNKTILLGTLSIGANTLNVTGANTYALRFGATTLTGNATVNPTSANLTLNAVGESGTGRSLTKSGSGSLTLTGTGSYSGGTVISAGTLNISSDGNLGDAAGGITFSGNSTLQVTGATTSARQITLDPGVTATFTGGGAAYSNSGKVTGAGGISCTVGASTSRSFAFNNTGNDFTGAISVDGNAAGQSNSATFNSLVDSASLGAGNISIGSNAGGVSAGASVTFNYGSGAIAALILDNRRINLLGNGSNTNATGATFSNLSTTYAVTVNTALLASGSNGKLTLSAAAGPTNVFAGLIANGSSSGVIINKAGGGTWSLTNVANTYTGVTSMAASGGILNVTKLDNGGVASSIGASSNAAANLLIGTGARLRYTGSGDTTDRSFTINGTSNAHNAILDASGTGALVLNSTATPGYGTTAQTRTLTLSGSNTDANTLAATLTNNGGSAVSVNKLSPGRWVITGTNVYTGATTINAGVIQALDGTGLPAASTLELRGGIFQSNGTFTRVVSTAAGAVNWSTSSGGFAAIGGTLNLQLNGGTASVTWNGASMVQTGQALIFGSSTADSLVDFQNALNLGSSSSGQRTITVDDNPASTSDIARISGAITNTAAGWGILKDGAGTLELTNLNTYTGVTGVNAGTLTLGVDDCLANTSNVVIGAGILNLPAAVNDEVGTLDVSAAATINLGSGATLAFADSKAVDWTGGTLNITGTFVPGTSLRFGTDSTGLTSTQLASISVNGSGAGTYTLDANGYLTNGTGPGPLDHFAITAISSPQTVGTPITGITLTAQDVSNATVTGFTGTVTFGGTGGFIGTSASFTAGVLSGVVVTPTVAGSNLTFTVDDGASHTGSTTITTIQSQYDAWAGGAAFDADSNGDGVKNGLAFLLGASGPNAPVTRPVVSQSSGNLILTFSCLNAASRGNATLSVQHSSDLGITDPWTAVTVTDSNSGPTSGVTFAVTPGSPTNSVTVTISSSEAAVGKLFGRLNAVTTP